MRSAVGDRLPSFTATERDRLLGSLDFLGFNHYSSWYVSPAASEQQRGRRNDAAGDWFLDQQTVVSKFDLQGRLIGPQGASPWLNTVPEGMTAALCWVDQRYHRPLILITENGCDAPGENSRPLPAALDDPFRSLLPSHLHLLSD
jgi:beta-glucosidase/6-phospho-beta-glucosidase/beta-galactosidase